jgi:hypothetical protein
MRRLVAHAKSVKGVYKGARLGQGRILCALWGPQGKRIWMPKFNGGVSEDAKGVHGSAFLCARSPSPPQDPPGVAIRAEPPKGLEIWR